MADSYGRVVWLWGPLFLVAVLVLVFQLGATGGIDSRTGKPRVTSSGELSAGSSPGAAVTLPSRGGGVRRAHDGFAPFSGYPPATLAAGPVPYPGAATCPPWTGYGWPASVPRPGDHSGRYWGSGAAEWGPPIGEYGPDAEIDPYWWVAAEDTDQ